MNWWVQSVYDNQGAMALVSWIFWVLFSITLHELGHGIAAIRQGDRTPIEQGRMTLNPVVHMGPFSLIVFAIVGIAWGAMPVNPHRFRNGQYGDVIVSAAGPAVNAILALLCIVILGIVTRFAPDLDNVQEFFFYGAMLNIVLAIFNLLPVPPLDGSRILGGFFPPVGAFFSDPQRAQIAFFAVIFIIWFTPIFRGLFTFAAQLTFAGADMVRTALGG